MKISRTLSALGGSLFLLPTLTQATVYTFSGDNTPDNTVVIEEKEDVSNGATNAALYTTIVFGGTNWVADEGFLKMTTGPSRGIWFGTSNSGYSDNSGISLSDSATGNRIFTEFLLTPGSQSWGFYFYDQDGYLASMQVDQTDNGQTRPGVWVSLKGEAIQVSDSEFKAHELHSFEAHLYNGEVVYRLDGDIVATGLASSGGSVPGLTVIGDGSGSTPTGTGSMWIDYLEIDNAAGEFSLALIPEPASAVSILGISALLFCLRRRR